MTNRNTPSTVESLVSFPALCHFRALAQLALVFAGLVLVVGTAAAQSPGEAFCNTDMAQTIQNIFMLIQFGGPLLGGVLALGAPVALPSRSRRAPVALPSVRQSDWKKELKSIRNQGLPWGVIVAPLGTQIVEFILNNVFAGGTSGGF